MSDFLDRRAVAVQAAVEYYKIRTEDRFVKPTLDDVLSAAQVIVNWVENGQR